MYRNEHRMDNLSIDHHLRSPISIILGMVHVLKKESLSQEQKRYIDTIGETAEDLSMLANKLSSMANEISGIEKKPYKKQKILLVEDHPTIQLVHKTMLLDMQCEVDIADDAEAALLLLTKKYDLILLDIGLPGMNGIQLAKIIRDGTTINRETTIYALTAYSATETKKGCLKSGIDRVLLKPITFEALELIIRKL